MAFSSGRSSVCLEELLNKTTEADILNHYLGVSEIPILMSSPLREDRHPSFSLYSPDGIHIYFMDFSTKEHGDVVTLMSKIWNISRQDTILKLFNDISTPRNSIPVNISKSTSLLQCKVRSWEIHDIKYWESYGISLQWLEYAEVYPISHIIITKDSNRSIINTDKYAYAFIEHKENKTTIKVYQPFNTRGYKWINKHDKSVVGLWEKVPVNGDIICICSSIKDALCLWANIGIPSIAIQGEAFTLSDTAIKVLRDRYKHIFICLDNDSPGIIDADKLSQKTGFTNIVLPQFEGGKDISDFYHVINNKQQFQSIISKLFKAKINGT